MIKKKKPNWIKIKIPINLDNIKNTKKTLYNNKLVSVCEKAICPNLSKCFNKKIATFMILGSICTRKCTFCNLPYGRPNLPDLNEPKRLAYTIKKMKLKYVVLTSVDRDDLKDGGSKHFVKCINYIKKKNINIKIEILVPDFRNCLNLALKIISKSNPDVFSHNIENVPRLYKKIKPGANYFKSLLLLKKFKKKNPLILTKSSIIMGLGETFDEVIKVIINLKSNNVDIITFGQYLQPSKKHDNVNRYIEIKEFNFLKRISKKIGFKYVKSGPLIRSSYRADLQFKKKKKNLY